MKFLVILLLLGSFRFGMIQQAKAPVPVAKKAAVVQKFVTEGVDDFPGEAVQPREKVAVQKALSPELHPGVALKAEGKVIDVEVGHAAPFVADVHGDGKLSLLVGQFGGGKLRLYALDKRNGEGYQAGKMEWVKAGAGDCSVPSG